MRVNTLKISTAVVMLGAGVVWAASATAVSVATNGGSSSANASAQGNADATAYAGATNGGRAVANSSAYGNRAGYASSDAVAMADHGLAISNSRADARGTWGGTALATSESLAGAINGVAISNSEADARGSFGGDARSHSYSTALSRWGYADSDSRAVSRGSWGGRAVSTSDALSDTHGGVSRSRVLSDSDAGFRATARADGVGISVSGPRRTSGVNVPSKSRSSKYGQGNSRAVAVEVR